MTDFEPSVTAARAKEKRNRHSKDLAMPHSSPDTTRAELELAIQRALMDDDSYGVGAENQDDLEAAASFSATFIANAIRSIQPSTPERKAWLVKWKSKDTTTYYDEPPPPTASMESVTPIHADQCSAGSEDARKWVADEWKRQIIHAGGDESVAQQAVALAALNGLFDYVGAAQRAGEPVSEEDLARCLYEAEYDGEAYPWHRQRPDEQLTYRQQAQKVLRDFRVSSLTSTEGNTP